LSTAARADPDEKTTPVTPVVPGSTGVATVVKPAAVEPAKKPAPFYGFVAALDPAARKFTIHREVYGTQTYTVTSKCRMTKAGQPFDLQDLKVGDFVRGRRIWISQGQWEVVRLIVEEQPPASAAGVVGTSKAAGNVDPKSGKEGAGAKVVEE